MTADADVNPDITGAEITSVRKPKRGGNSIRYTVGRSTYPNDEYKMYEMVLT